MTEFEINGKEYDVVNYDLDNRINKVDVDGDEAEYRYDAMGRRVLRKEGSNTTALIWWGNSECAEHKHTANKTVIQNDIFEHPTRLNAVIARAIDGSKFDIQYFHKNYLDHVYAVSDDRGDFIEHYRYTAFGEVTIYDESGNIQQETQIDNDILWNTRRLDEVSGFYLYKYRHYAPELGRWPSRDPIEEDGGVNLHAFVGNNPINWMDLLGLAAPDGFEYVPVLKTASPGKKETDKEWRVGVFKFTLTAETSIESTDTSLKLTAGIHFKKDSGHPAGTFDKDLYLAGLEELGAYTIECDPETGVISIDLEEEFSNGADKLSLALGAIVTEGNDGTSKILKVKASAGAAAGNEVEIENTINIKIGASIGAASFEVAGGERIKKQHYDGVKHVQKTTQKWECECKRTEE